MKHETLTGEGSAAAEGDLSRVPSQGGRGGGLASHAAFDAVILTDREGLVLEAGGAAADLFGRGLEDCVGLALSELLLAPEARIEREAGRGALAAVDSFPYEGRLLAATGRHASGRTFPVSVNVERLAGNGPARFVSFVRDISELQEARERRDAAERELEDRTAELRALSLKLPLDIESERRRIARGLHDQIGNSLAMAKMGLGQLRRSSSDETTLAALDEIERQTAKAMQEIRSLTFELSSPVLYELGLEAALKSLGKRLAERHAIQFRFSSDGEPKPLSEDHQVILYRTVEELLVNMVKHAWASKAQIAVDRSGEEIRIAVEDDGVGFESQDGKQPGPDGGFGLYGVRQRLAHIDGRLEIESAFPSGTRATVCAPLETED